MMFEKKLGKIGINKGIVFGILFMILVLGVLISVKMVMGAGGGFMKVVPNGQVIEEDTQISLDEAKAQTHLDNVEVGDEVEGTTLKKQDSTTFKNPNEIDTKVTKTQNGYKLDNGQEVKKGGDVTIKDSTTTQANKPSTQLTTPSGQGEVVTEGTATTKCAGPKGAGSGEPGGGGGAGGGGAGDKAIMDAASQAMSLAAQVGGPIKQYLEEKDKVNPPSIKYPDDPSGEVTTTVQNGALANINDGSKSVTLAQNDPKNPGFVKGVTLKDFNTGNSVIAIYGSLDAIIVTPPYKTTHVINDLAKGNPGLTNKPASSTFGGVITWFLPFFRLIGFVDAASSDITGDVIVASPDQEIKLKDHEIGLSGEDLIVDIFKSFDKLNAKGTNVNLYDGKVAISFKNLKTYYPRLVLNNSYFINEIRNEYDTKNVFMLVPQGAKGNYFEDARHVLTVGDSVVENPLNGYENVSIPATRYEMWKRAAKGDMVE